MIKLLKWRTKRQHYWKHRLVLQLTGQLTSQFSILYWPDDVFILHFTSIGALTMSCFTRLYFKSHSFYPRKRRRFSPGFTDASGRTDPPIILSDGRSVGTCRVRSSLFLFLWVYSHLWWWAGAGELPRLRSSLTVPRGAPTFSLLTGHLKSRASTVQSQEDVYLSAIISSPSMCESISVPMEDHVCHGNKDCHCFEVLTVKQDRSLANKGVYWRGHLWPK